MISLADIFWHSAVAPLVGAWIEIAMVSAFSKPSIVAPLVGAWIEIKLLLSPGT